MATGDRSKQANGHWRAITLVVPIAVTLLASACAAAPTPRSSPVGTAVAKSAAAAPSAVISQGWIAVPASPSVAGENDDIYLLSAGASPRLVIGHAGDGIAHECPAFSPDGQRLAYGSARASGAVTNNRGLWPVSDRAVVVVEMS